MTSTATYIEPHAAIIIRCRDNEAKAQYELYQLYKKAMFSAAMRILNDMAEAEDVLQESFLSAFKNINNFKGDSAFGLWLKRIVVNKAIRTLKQRRFALVTLPEEGDIPPEPEPDYAFEAEQIQAVRQAIQKLPDGYRVVLSLYLLEGFDHAEIAEVLHVSEATSKSQYSRARKKLLEILKVNQ